MSHDGHALRLVHAGKFTGCINALAMGDILMVCTVRLDSICAVPGLKQTCSECLDIVGHVQEAFQTE
jgi:hypothetical protein